MQGLSLSWYQTSSNTGPANFDLAYSTDGTTFTQFGTYAVTNDSWSSSSPPAVGPKSFDLSGITTLDNAATVYFRLRVVDTVAVNDSAVATTGTCRVDDFTVMAASAGPTPPVITQHPQSITIPTGASTTLSVVATGADSYQWYEGIAPDETTQATGPTATTADYTTPNLDTTTSYWVKVTNANGSVNSDTATVTVSSAPIVTSTTPEDTATLVPADTTITIEFSDPVSLSSDAFTISDGVNPPVGFTAVPPLPALGVSSIVLTPGAPLADGATYTVTVHKDEVTPAMNADYVFSFTTLAPVVITQHPSPQNVVEGQNATFTVTVDGDSPSYAWFKDGVTPVGTDSPSLILNAVTDADEGDYHCVVTGPGTGNTATSASASLTVSGLNDPVTLTGGSYTQNFDGIAAGLPPGWSVRTGATATEIGALATFLATPTANTASWGSSTGNFRNSASTTGMTGLEDNNTQFASANRALGVRQTGSFGDPGASFNLAISSTGKVVTGISFEAQMLSVQTRSTIWYVQAGVGEVPASWQTLGIFTDPGVFGSTTVEINGAALAALADQPHAWIRIVALDLSSGSGARDTFGIDDFVLTFEDDTEPLYWDANDVIAGAGATPSGIWGDDDYWSTDAAGAIATGAWTPGGKAAFSAGTDATGDYTIQLAGAQQASGIFFEDGNQINLVGGSLVLSGLPRLDVGAGVTFAATIASEIQGAAGLIKTGPGVLALVNPANSFSGLISINGGFLAINSDGALGQTDNDINLGGVLGIMAPLSLNADRNLTGAGGVVLLEDATVTINGSITTAAFSVGTFTGDTGAVAFAGPVNTLGALSFASPATTPPPAALALTGQPLTINGITVTDSSATVTIANDLIVPLASANLTVAAASTLTLNGLVSTPNTSGNNSLRKFGEGILVLPAANPGLHRVSLGGQGETPTHGGTLQIHDKGALGVSQPFLNYGTLQIMTALTGADALPNGISISGRAGSPIIIAGEDLDIAGTNNIYGTAGTGAGGSVVRLEVNNHTTFTGPFIVDPGSVVAVDTLNLGGTGLVTIASPSFPIALILSDGVTLEFDSDSISTSSASAGLLVESGATLHPGTDGGARLVEVRQGFTLASGGTLVLDIVGASQYDALNLVTSAASHTVAGTLEVRLDPGYVPQAGHAFQLLDWASDATADLASATLDLPPLGNPELEWKTDLFASEGIVFISGAGLGPVIVSQPQSKSVASTDFVEFSVTAIGEGLAYQWLFNGEPIEGAINSTLIFNATPARAGFYSVIVSNGAGSILSEEALLLVDGFPVIKVPPQSVAAAEGVEVGFDVVAVGPEGETLSYQWQFDGGFGFADLPSENGPSLTVTAGGATYGSYRVVVTNQNETGSVTSAAAVLSPPYDGPPTHAPEWDHSGPLPAGQIGLAYSFTPQVKPDDFANEIYRSAERFTATGLPAGLTINQQTGEISGIPAAIKATPYNVKITARNVAGSAVLTTSILINPLPTGIEGTFTGLVGRSQLLANVPNDAANGPLGGRIDFKVAKTGKVSGKVIIGAKAFAFRSAVAVDPLDASQALMTANIVRKKPAGLSDLVVNLTITGAGVLADASVTDGNAPDPAAVAGWRNPWSKTNRADALAGYYTLKLDLVQPEAPATPYTSAEAPLGSGYLSFTVNPTTGKLTLKGKLADGSTITLATFAGPAGQILLFRPLYAAKVRGSVLGALEIEALPDPTQNTLEGDIEWWRPANTAKSNRLYRDGFPAVLDLLATGGRYVPPAKNERVLGLTEANNLIEVLFSEAGVEGASPPATVEGMKGAVAPNNKVTFSKDFATINTRRATLTFTAKTGAFKAVIKLSEPNPLPPNKLVNRTVTAQGLIVGAKGEGYFILNQLPAVAPETPSNTAQQGGKAVVQPVVAP